MAVNRMVGVNELREGRYIVIDEEPCKIVGIKISKPGKHGEAKARIEAMGVFDDKKRSLIKPTGHKVEVPEINKKNAQVLSVIGTMVQLMDMETYDTFELPIPEDLKDTLIENAEVIYMESMGKKKLLQIRG